MKRPLVMLIALSTLALFTTARAVAEGELSREELEVDHALTLDFPTPHTDWAQPFAGGTTRVLFFCEGKNTQPRECVELIQRFDLQAKAVFWARIVDTDRTHWHGGDAGIARMIQLLAEPWDAFVFFDLTPAQMPTEAQYKLLKAVTDGAGLVMVGKSDSRVLKDKNRIAKLPPLLADPVGEAFTVVRGRGIRLPKRPDIPYHEGWQLQDDYWHERLGRAVLWAAGHEPPMQLQLTISKPKFDRSEQGQRLTIQVSGKPKGDRPQLHVRLRRPADEPIDWPATPVDSAKPSTIDIPALPAGDFHAEASVVSSAGVEGWATIPFQVTSAHHIGDLKLSQDWGEIGDHLAGAVTLAGQPGADEIVRVRLLDRRRRELVRSDAKAAVHREFDFTIASWMPMLLTVEAQILNGSREVARASQYFRVTKRHRGQFNFVMWDVPTGTLAPYAEESLAKHSVTIHLAQPPQPPAYLAAFDCAYVPYTTRILNPLTPEGIMKPFCWNDPDAVAKHVAKLADAYQPARQHGVFVYSLGDENHTSGCCLSPHCARAYRDYLREVYGSLDALNQSWGTKFAQWDEVGLSRPDDNFEESSLAQGNYPRWFDRRAFRSYNYVKYCQKYQTAYDAIDPKAKTGFEGAGRFAGGDDLDLIIRSLGFWSPYPGTADEVARSLAPRQMPRANWMGYTKDADSLLAKYWRMVTRGMDAVWWWRWDCIGRFHGWLAPDLRPYPAVKEILADTQIVRDGLGDLLLKSQMRDDGIAILFSYPSVFAHGLAEGETFGKYEAAHTRIHENLRDLGFQFSYVSDRQLRLGEFDPTRYRILILPRTDALGDREADVIRRFVDNGGTLLADVRPGLYDDHCKPRQQGILDDLFGIKREGRPKSVAGHLTTNDRSPLPLDLQGIAVDPAVKVVDPSAMTLATVDGSPAIIVRPCGKGRAVLLNFSANTFPSLANPGTPEAAADAVRRLLAESGVAPFQTVTTEVDKRFRDLEITRWQNGNIDIISLVGHGHDPAQATVHLAGGPRYVYDLRNRKPIGQTATFSTTVLPNRASFFVLAPKPAPSARLDLNQPAVTRGTVVTATLSVPDPVGLHAFRIRARVGDKPLDWLDQNLIVGQQPIQFDIPVAYNDPPGDYRIEAVDLFTNEPAVATMKVH